MIDKDDKFNFKDLENVKIGDIFINYIYQKKN